MFFLTTKLRTSAKIRNRIENVTKKIIIAFICTLAKYHGVGNRLRYQIPGNRATDYSYDQAGQLRGQSSQDSSHAPQQNLSYSWAGGLLRDIKDNVSGQTSHYDYDLAGNRTLEQTMTSGANTEIRGISGMGSPARGEVARLLTESEIAHVQNAWSELSGDPAKLRINEGPFTGVSDRNGSVVYVRGDVFPTTSDSLHPTANLSVRETLAHEMGHLEYLDTGVAPRAWNDEFMASYWTSKNVQGLTELEQRNLVIDVAQRATDAGQKINMNTYMRSVIYGFQEK